MTNPFKSLCAGLLLMLLLSLSTHAAVFTGRIVNEEDEPLPGVSIATDISGVGTLSDQDGRFKLETDRSVRRLTFSSVGYISRQFAVDQLPETIVLIRLYYRGSDITVHSTRAERGVTPVSFDNISSDEIKRDYTVEEFPLLLESTPNAFVYSDAGASLGYPYVRIRGFDDRRVVTYVNGVPLNDPEDQITYFIDLPDFAANVSDIQVQRGVGNSLY
ncbi:MAG TPA: carboxypeptidase-like regulatory domain-containing protein, partial [Planctomycetaceae bacterium]|nr:carboxypeptidase-like regulatory domain-containing protein [Planctomycetaceae bacterium]